MQTMPRDFRMSSTYFGNLISLKKNRGIEEGQRFILIVPRPTKRSAQFLFTLFRYHVEVLFMHYSAGHAIHELRECFPSLIDAWESANSEEKIVFAHDELVMRKQFKNNLDFYVICLWTLSLAVCLDVEQPLLERVLQLCENEGEDWLFEELASSRVQGRKQTSTVLYPKTYNLLKFAIQESRPVERNRLLRGFIQKWYPSLSKTYWHDCHEGPDGGGYFGYWCFELAAAVKVFKLDDNAVIDSPYYPKDLIR